MDAKEVYRLLKSTGIPTTHNVFLKVQKPPYLLYRDDDTDIIAANSRAVLKKQRITVELYSSPTEINNAEKIVENLLDEFTTYSKNRSFDDEQQLYVTYYNFYII
ncbi:MAG: hypothetical protein IJ861_00780 [Clostridia bacterium]|nr:hypothetical protein [Clostridia bacterium]